MDKYDAGIYSDVRWSKQFKEFEKLKPDIIALQEVRTNYLNLLKEQEFIRNDYFLVTMDKEFYGNYTALTLIKKTISIENSYAYRYISSSYSIAIVVDMRINNKILRLINVHLRPYSNNYGIRSNQLKELYDITKTSKNFIILGDFNFECFEDEKSIDTSICYDVFSKLNPNKQGFTFDSLVNDLIDWEGIDRKKDRFRTDRIVVSNESEFIPKTIDIIFNKSLKELLPNWNLKNSDKLFMGDHFGLLMKIE